MGMGLCIREDIEMGIGMGMWGFMGVKYGIVMGISLGAPRRIFMEARH